MRPFGQRQQVDMQDAIRTFGQEVLVLDGAEGGRRISARVRMLTAAELVNCAELYNTTVTVAARDFPDYPPRKGLLLLVNGVRRGVVEVLERRPSGRLVGWQLGVKG